MRYIEFLIGFYRENILEIISFLKWALVINYFVSTLAFMLYHPELTEMQVFLHTPYTFIWDFKVQ